MNADNDQMSAQYLTFGLDQEVFALGIAEVREVLELPRITSVPRVPEHIRGVINLRGHAVPVMELRKRFGMHDCEDTVDTCIIITEMRHQDRSSVVGVQVDSVREVIEMQDEHVERPPSMGAGIDTAFLKGIGRRDEDFVLILDTDRILSGEELAMLQRETGEADEDAPDRAA